MKSDALAAMARVASGIHKTAANDGLRETAISKARIVFGTFETQATTFGMAYANGRWGGDEGEISFPVPGTSVRAPLDLTLGFIGLTFSLFGLFGPFGEHVANVADGFVSNWMVRAGQSLGASHRGTLTKNVAAGVTSHYDAEGKKAA